MAPLFGPDTVRPEILLVGCGARTESMPVPVREHFKAQRIALEAMDTGAACRTYNVLIAESRLVAAALIAV